MRKLLIPDESITIDSLSLPIEFKTNTEDKKTAKGRICESIFGITEIVKPKNIGMLAPLKIASSSILKTCVSQANDNIAIQTINNDTKSFLIIYLSILAIALRLYTTYHIKVINRFLFLENYMKVKFVSKLSKMSDAIFIILSKKSSLKNLGLKDEFIKEILRSIDNKGFKFKLNEMLEINNLSDKKLKSIFVYGLGNKLNNISFLDYEKIGGRITELSKSVSVNRFEDFGIWRKSRT